MKVSIPERLTLSFLHNNFNTIKKTSTGELRVNSPYAEDTKFHLYIEPKKGLFKDFKSGEKGSISRLIAFVEGIKESQVLTFLVQEYGAKTGEVSSFKEIIKVSEQERLRIPDGLKFFVDGDVGIIGRKALKYLLDRKVSQEYIQEFGYINDPSSEFNNRIFIPFYENGELVYFVARSFVETKLRYLNPPGIDTKKYVYNIDKIENEVVICEGIFDAISLKNQVATALMSADLGISQASKIMNKGIDTVIFVPDNDETGAKTLDNNIRLLLKYKPPSISLKIYVYHIPAGYKDFNEFLIKTGKDSIHINECENFYSDRKIVIPSYKKKGINI